MLHAVYGLQVQVHERDAVTYPHARGGMGSHRVALQGRSMLIRRKPRPDPYWWLCHALWLLVTCRVAILVIVDLSSFPAINVSYLSATFPLFWAAPLLTAYLPFHMTQASAVDLGRDPGQS